MAFGGIYDALNRRNGAGGGGGGSCTLSKSRTSKATGRAHRHKGAAHTIAPACIRNSSRREQAANAKRLVPVTPGIMLMLSARSLKGRHGRLQEARDAGGPAVRPVVSRKLRQVGRVARAKRSRRASNNSI